MEGRFVSQSVVTVETRPKTSVRSVKSVKSELPDRHARHRARVKAGIACTTVEYSAEVLDLLVRLGWLTEPEASDRDAVGRAIGELIRDAARR
jgi:hypothetical protein